MTTIDCPALTPEENRSLGWAILASLVLHVVLATQIPKINFLAEDKSASTVLTVELMAPQSSDAQPTALPEPEIVKPTEPEPIQTSKPEPLPAPRPAPKPLPPPVKPTPSPVEPQEPTTQDQTQPTSKESHTAISATMAEIMMAQPQEHMPQAPVVPTPAPVSEPVATTPQPSGPSQEDLDAARNQYGSQLARAIAKYKQYPKLAQMRGWQGEVLLEVHCDDRGQVLSTHVKQSSGHSILDEQAMTMVKKASPLPSPPDILRSNKKLVILIPVPFTLESS